MSVNNRIRELRKNLGLNQTDFAEKIGITQTWLSMLESGQRQVVDKNITLISSIFGASEHWLKSGEGEMFSNSPYEDEFLEIYSNLSKGTQKHLLAIALELQKAEKEIETQNNL